MVLKAIGLSGYRGESAIGVSGKTSDRDYREKLLIRLSGECSCPDVAHTIGKTSDREPTDSFMFR